MDLKTKIEWFAVIFAGVVLISAYISATTHLLPTSYMSISSGGFLTVNLILLAWLIYAYAKKIAKVIENKEKS